MSLQQLTIAEARDRLRAGDVTATDLTHACLSAIDAGSPLNAFVHHTPDIALAQAEAADQRLRAGDAPSMCGIPVGIKDLFCTRGVASQAASRILEGFLPEYESTVTQNLFDAGAVMLGKLNMDEFAMGSSNETSVYGNAVNPWKSGDAPLTPGGSSGGSAAAVAADLCLAATGTDTGGSIRQPAAFTGIVGLKPTYGRVSRWGTIAFASSLDQAGPMTRTVRDAAIMLGAMASVDPKDSTSADRPVPVGAFADHVFGICLLNDWSARDLQAWEYVPLGPFLGKSFATSISAWVTPLAALTEARVDLPGQEPEPLPYLSGPAARGIDLHLQVTVNGTVVARPEFRHVYWSPEQMLAHLTVNGASLRNGDLFASGTVSGAEAHTRGSLLELTWNGRDRLELDDGTARGFLEDGDVVTMTAWAPGPGGSRVGVGEVTGRIVPGFLTP